MAISAAADAGATILDAIREHLEGLKRTPDGAVLYETIQRGLSKYEGGDGRLETAFVDFLHGLLGRYASAPDIDSATRFKARLIQQRLALHRLESAVSSAHVDIGEQSANMSSRWSRIDSLTGRRAAAPPKAAAPAPEPAPRAQPASATASEAGVGQPAPSVPEQPAAGIETVQASIAPSAEAEVVENAAAPAPQVDEASASETVTGLDADVNTDVAASTGDVEPSETGEVGADALERLEVELVDGVADSIAGEDTGTDIGVSGEGGALADIADLKKLLVKGLDELIREQSQLKSQLAQAGRRIQEADAERRKLATDLSKARKHAYTDELTGLTKRDGFVRQLEAEIGRASRYGFAVAVALIDIDGLGAINDAFGDEGGDKVLRYYATEVLSRFRGYDMVARYGGDEFAVLFPNTQKSGALRALEKARAAASGTYITLDGRSVPLPTFSSVLTMYAHGEQPLALLKRADEALDHAKRSGSDRVVMALLEH